MRAEHAAERRVIEASGIVYECVSRSGKGSFGVVYKAVTRGSGQVVAIKRVLQDPRYKVRPRCAHPGLAHAPPAPCTHRPRTHFHRTGNYKS